MNTKKTADLISGSLRGHQFVLDGLFVQIRKIGCLHLHETLQAQHRLQPAHAACVQHPLTHWRFIRATTTNSWNTTIGIQYLLSYSCKCSWMQLLVKYCPNNQEIETKRNCWMQVLTIGRIRLFECATHYRCPGAERWILHPHSRIGTPSLQQSVFASAESKEYFGFRKSTAKLNKPQQILHKERPSGHVTQRWSSYHHRKFGRSNTNTFSDCAYRRNLSCTAGRFSHQMPKNCATIFQISFK